MFFTIALVGLGLVALDEFLEPIAARKRTRRREKKIGRTTEILEIGNVALTEEEAKALDRAGVLSLLAKRRQAYQDLKKMRLV